MFELQILASGAFVRAGGRRSLEIDRYRTVLLAVS